MVGFQGQRIPVLSSFIVVLFCFVHQIKCETDIYQKESKGERGSGSSGNVDLHGEEYRKWIQEQENLVVNKIMEKIANASDTEVQHAAKVAVAKYLVEVTFTAMARKLETLRMRKKQSFLPSSAALPVSAVPEETLNQTSLPASPTTGGVAESASPTYPSITSTTILSVSTDPPFVFKGGEDVANGTLSALPTSSSGVYGFPASSTLTEQIEAENGKNGTSAMKKPIWEEILTFNFSAALNGGNEGQNLLSRLGGNNGEMGGGLLSRLNLTALRGGGEGGGSTGLLGGLNLTALTGGNSNGGAGGLLARLNLTGLGSGGEGGPGGLLARLNLTGLGGNGEGGPGGLLARLNLTSLGGNGESGPSRLLARLNITLGNGETGPGSIFSRLNFTALGGGEGMGSGGIFSRFNLSSLTAPKDSNSSMNETKGGLPFSLPGAPPGLFNVPTPPPMNDSVRMSQMYLGNQIEKLMGNVNSSNLTGIVESTINIATPNTVGVLVNALLNIVLCNPLDRFNGNCGIE